MGSMSTDRRLGLASDRGVKSPVTAVALTNVVLSGEQTVDGYACKAVNSGGYADRVLCTAQTNPIENGPWDVSTAAWTRSQDGNGNNDLSKGTMFLAAEGTQAGILYQITSNNPVQPGTTAITIGPISGASSIALAAQLLTSVGASLIGWIQAGAGAVMRTVQSKLRDRVSVFDFMTTAQIADVQAGTLSLDVTTPFTNACAYAQATSGKLYLPAGKYKLSTIALTGVRGLVIEGAGSALYAGGVTYASNTVLSFDAATAGTHGLDFENFVGLVLRDFVISMRRGGVAGGTALYLHNGHDFALENIKVDLLVGSGGSGITMGAGTGATAAFLGKISNCKVFSNGASAFFANYSTTLSFISCYQVGGFFRLFSTSYSTLQSCGSELSPSYGYIIDGSSTITINACGAEQCLKGAYYLSTGTNNVVINTPYGAANNTSADATIGDLVMIDGSAGAVEEITINNPVSETPNAATTFNIYANAGNGLVYVNNTNYLHLSKGIGGHSVWIATKLTVTGYYAKTAWTPVLGGAGWTNTGTPTFIAWYVKNGNVINFYVTIFPGGGTLSCVKGTAYITGLPFGAITNGAGTMTDDNATTYGSVVLNPPDCKIYPQTAIGLAVNINIAGTIIL